jgi:phosphopantetheinyl transferase (holo-ACP synthase)
MARPYVGWLDVVLRRRARPEILLHGKAKEYAASLGITRFHLALTHTNTLAEAQVIAEG